MLLEAVSTCHYSAGLRGDILGNLPRTTRGGSSQGLSHLQPPSAWGERGCLGWQGWEGALLELPGLQMWFYVLVNATLLQRVCLDPQSDAQTHHSTKRGRKQDVQAGAMPALSSPRGYLAGSDGSLLIFGALSSAQLRYPGGKVVVWGLWSARSCRGEKQQLNQAWWPETFIFMTVEELNL